MNDISNPIVNQKKWVGGARLDVTNATWPFATLTISRELLELKVKQWGSISFRPDYIIKIEPVGCFPLIGKGIRIHHKLNALQNPTIVIFWYLFGDSKALAEELHLWGFGGG